MASVAKHIRRLRTEQHLTQEDLAGKLFVTRQTVSAWETGKAQPDLETLERIAAALGVEVTELIYGAPRSPNLRKLKQEWAVIGGGCVLVLAVIVLILLKNGTYGTWRHGLAFQLSDSNYQIAFTEVSGDYSVELDLTDLDRNAGKVLYQEESGCRILVDSVDENEPGEYRVWFRAYGVSARTGGTLVSGCQSTPVEKNSWSLDMDASMTAAVEGQTYPCTVAGTSGLIYRDGNLFGFHLNPRTEDRQPVSIQGLDHVTVTVAGLTRLTTQRISYWDHY